MKLSVILGVAQMSLGVCLKATNAIYFERKYEFIFEFIPQIVLLWVLFGFMDFIIIIKWLTDYSNTVGATPPSIISLIVAMFLSGGETDDTPLFTGQTQVMQIFLIIALLCIPTMLLVKPLIEYSKFKEVVLAPSHV